MGHIGTKAQFTAWLSAKGFSYTEYARWTPEKKQSIQEEYKGK